MCPHIANCLYKRHSLSLLLFADVLTFCSEKESLFVTLESFKEREATRPLADSPMSQFRKQKQQIAISMRRLLPICREPPTRVPCTVLLTYLVVIHCFGCLLRIHYSHNHNMTRVHTII